MDNNGRMALEASIMRHVLRSAKAAGFECYAVDNGDGLVKVSSEKEAMEEARAADEAWVYFRKGNEKPGVFFVLGNDPWEVVCDYSFKPGGEFEKLMDAESEYADKVEVRYRPSYVAYLRDLEAKRSERIRLENERGAEIFAKHNSLKDN